MTRWQCLEGISGQVAVFATWRAGLGEDFEAFATFLKRGPSSAKSFPCPGQCGCYHEAIHCPDGSIVGVCRCDPRRCDDLTLRLEDLVLWQLNRPKLDRALCKAFGLDSKAADIGLWQTTQIGSWSADAVPVILTIQWDERDFRSVVAELVARLGRSFILFAPTSAHLGAACQELLAHAGAGFFGLDSHVVLTAQGNLQPRASPGDLFARFMPQATEAVPEDVARQAFALVQALDSQDVSLKAAVYTVFRLYCMEGLTVKQVAKKCGCARSLVFSRLKFLRQKLGRDPAELRLYSGQFNRIEDSLCDPRAKRVNRKGATYGDNDSEE